MNDAEADVFLHALGKSTGPGSIYKAGVHSLHFDLKLHACFIPRIENQDGAVQGLVEFERRCRQVDARGWTLSVNSTTAGHDDSIAVAHLQRRAVGRPCGSLRHRAATTSAPLSS